MKRDLTPDSPVRNGAAWRPAVHTAYSAPIATRAACPAHRAPNATQRALVATPTNELYINSSSNGVSNDTSQGTNQALSRSAASPQEQASGVTASINPATTGKIKSATNSTATTAYQPSSSVNTFVEPLT